MADDSDDVDEALEETFPASDPPANTVETGIGVMTPAETDVTEGGETPSVLNTPRTRRPDSNTATAPQAPPKR